MWVKHCEFNLHILCPVSKKKDGVCSNWQDEGQAISLTWKHMSIRSKAAMWHRRCCKIQDTGQVMMNRCTAVWGRTQFDVQS